MRARSRLLLVAIVVVHLLAPRMQAQTAAVDFSAIDRVIAQELTDTHTPGAAVSIVSGDRVVFSKGYGVASVETREPVRPEMLFRLGSTTKMFTAAALALLAEKGAVDLNAPIGNYVKDLHPKIAQLTAHQLLSHTSGFLDEAPMFGSDDESALETDSAPKGMTSAEMADLAGTYSQSTRTMSIVQRDGRLFLARSNGETALEKVGANSFRAGDSRLVTVADAAGKVEYLHTGGRSWRKVS